jgi:hypothetical protein
MTNATVPQINSSQIQPPLPLSTEQLSTVVLPDQPWSAQRALIHVRDWFNRAETWRIQNYDRSLRRNDDTYYAVTKVKTWDGTRIPRASIPIWMAVRHVQAIHSHVMQALFADDYPFEALPEMGTSMQDAIKVREVLRTYLQDMNPDVLGMTAREIFSRSWYSALVYGCGPIELGWLMREMKRQVYTRKQIPEMIRASHPVTGQEMQLPSGKFNWTVDRGTKTYQISRPKAQSILVYDFYFDPNCPSPNPQESNAVATRQLLPIGYLKEICLPEFGFSLPENDVQWKDLVVRYKQTMAEVSASWGELNRGNYWNRSYEISSDLASQRVEVIRWWNNERHVWLIGRDHLAFNDGNELGIKPFVNNYYIPAPGRPYSISVCDVLEGEQKLTQNLVEGRLDEVNLKIHPPVVKKLGVKIAASQRRLRPGIEWEVPDDATKDITIMNMGDVLPAAYVEVNAAEMRGQQTTGANDVAAMGTGTSGGNSANRTATGVNTQNAAFSSRIQALVENCEDQAFEPFLKMLFLMAQKFGDPNQPIFAGAQSIDPLDVMNAQVKFKLRASDKLRIRRAAASGAFEMIVNQLAGLQAQLQMTGETINIDLVGNLIGDALGLPSGQFIVPMSPQQQQALQQQQMAPEMMKMQQMMGRMQALSTMSESRDDAKLMGDVIKKLLTPEVVAHIVKDSGEPGVLDLLKKKVEPKQLPAAKKN